MCECVEQVSFMWMTCFVGLPSAGSVVSTLTMCLYLQTSARMLLHGIQDGGHVTTWTNEHTEVIIIRLRMKTWSTSLILIN